MPPIKLEVSVTDSQERFISSHPEHPYHRDSFSSKKEIIHKIFI